MLARSRAGVAFWEVLVVLAIVSFLIAIFFPLFVKPQTGHNRRRQICAFHLKQLGDALTMYMEDNNEVFPGGVNATGNGWAGQIYPYVKNRIAYQCPDDTAKGKHISYAQNRNMSNRPIDRFSNPAATVALYETTTLNCDPSTAETISGVGLAAPQNSNRHDTQTHGLNFLAADGHVRWLLPAQVSSGPNAQAARTIKASSIGPVIETFAIK